MDRKFATPHGFVHRSVVVKEVGLDGQLNTWQVDAEPVPQSGQELLSAMPMRCL